MIRRFLTKIHTLALGLVCVLFLAPAAQAQVYNFVVAKDGSGTHTTIHAAIEAVRTNKPTRTLIFIKNGVYEEKLNARFINLSLIGESREGVIISWNDYSGKPGPGGTNYTTATSYTLWASADDLYMENITVRNTAGNVGQAVAIRTTGDRQVFKNCTFLGFQDTYYAHSKRQYNLDCYVEGATDFIFGDATTVFENSTINCVEGGQYITAHNDTKLISKTTDNKDFYHGLLFLNCTITANTGVPDNRYYLGRPWGSPGSTAFINTRMGNHIRAEGWSTWSGNNHLSGTFAEYQSKDLAGEPLDVSQRVDWSTQLTAEEVEAYYNLDYFLKKDNVIWDPRAATESLPAPAELTNNLYELTWQAVEGAKGYVISRNNTAISFSEATTFTDTGVDPAIANTYHIQAVAENGNLSNTSNTVTVQSTVTSVKGDVAQAFQVKIEDARLTVSEKVDMEVYTFSGKLLKKAKNTTQLNLNSLEGGALLIKLTNRKGETVVKKFYLGGR
ncbi:pectinesterase family protein [Pontibacter beigongshangensis]|uniref:pectinesterase family protein n=1 Tax=Pontibacter beigongshangensis TaxID=2574733 RepID=UPI00165077E9|nr:pectinesterase family protein [Pontibacter beigongshangensis]